MEFFSLSRELARGKKETLGSSSRRAARRVTLKAFNEIRQRCGLLIGSVTPALRAGTLR